MLSFHSDYSTALASPFKENWVVRLYKNDGTYIGISFADVTMGDSVSYIGAILNAPNIRESVDFSTGKAQTGNMTLEVADYAISSSTLLKTLYSGNYLNQSVKVYSTLGNLTDFAKIPQIFEGRLNGISSTENDKVKLEILVKRPWDDIGLPNVKSNNGVYQPVIYGDYTTNQYRNTNNVELAPLPFLTSNSIYMWYANHTSEANTALHFFDSKNKHFPLLTYGSSNSSTVEGIDAVRILDTINRIYRIKPTLNATDPSDFTNPSQSFNDSTSDSATSTLSVNDGSDEHELRLDLPQIAGKITSITMYVKWSITYFDNEQSPSHQVKFSYIKDYSGTQTEVQIHNDTDVNSPPSSSETHTSSGSPDIDNTGTAHGSYSVTLSDNKLPDFIEFKHFISQTNNSSTETLDSTLTISDVWFAIVSQVDTTNEPASAGQEKAQLEVVYSAHDGFTRSWTSGLAQKPHEIHRDILYRFLGVTDTPTNYSNLDSEKSGNCRFFTPIGDVKDIKSYLEKLAFEGGFVFRFRSDGTPVYHHIVNSPSVTSGLTLSHDDINGLKVGHTGLNEVVTKWTAQYEKNPAKSEYLNTATHTSSARTNFYGGSSKENVKEVRLEYLIDNVAHTGGNRNASFLDYYNDLLGNVKQKVSFRLVNPTKSYIEVGDIIAFNNSNMKIEALSGAWTNLKFIVTSTTRSVGGAIDVEAREI